MLRFALTGPMSGKKSGLFRGPPTTSAGRKRVDRQNGPVRLPLRLLAGASRAAISVCRQCTGSYWRNRSSGAMDAWALLRL